MIMCIFTIIVTITITADRWNYHVHREFPGSVAERDWVQPISELRFWIFEGLTQAES